MEIELDAFTTISLVSSNVNTNGDLTGLVDDAGNCCCICLKLNYHIASGKQIFVPMP